MEEWELLIVDRWIDQVVVVVVVEAEIAVLMVVGGSM